MVLCRITLTSQLEISRNLEEKRHVYQYAALAVIAKHVASALAAQKHPAAGGESFSNVSAFPCSERLRPVLTDNQISSQISLAFDGHSPALQKIKLARPEVKDLFTPRMASKILKAVDLPARTLVAHPNTHPPTLLSVLFAIERSDYAATYYEGDLASILRCLLAVLPKQDVREYLAEIESQPTKFRPIPANQLSRFSKVL